MCGTTDGVNLAEKDGIKVIGHLVTDEGYNQIIFGDEGLGEKDSISNNIVTGNLLFVKYTCC
jgi:hypothetical protein